ncbi:hypothetical protein AB6E53_15435 [Vibrio breoganii]
MMFKSADDRKIEALAKKIRKSDGRLSWETCVRKAKELSRCFGVKSRHFSGS